ncbi:hypothetical protein PVAND_016044 [Polypedilum vanderplanki]|uniref:Uncharacterized protein n=1 Tax=Polypedilum vanderplanki TaxID=319348 RepID=A0A9J6BDY8_POLVA|nr:hypothetical protein PVAND_016044 [Polypedilum vanderplanki]
MSICEFSRSLRIQTMEKITIWFQNLKFKIQNLGRVTTRVSPMFIQFSDFFWCDKYLTKIGYSVMQESQKNEEWQKNICIGTISLTVLIMAVLQVSFIRSILNLMDDDNIFIAMENFAVIGGICLTIIKWYLLLHRSRGKIIKVVAKLDEHYPHNGIDQLDFDTEKYLE